MSERGRGSKGQGARDERDRLGEKDRERERDFFAMIHHALWVREYVGEGDGDCEGGR